MREIPLDEAKSILGSLLADAAKGETVYISDDGHKVLLVSVPAHGPVFDIGKNPIDDEITDIARNHDHYIYGGK